MSQEGIEDNPDRAEDEKRVPPEANDVPGGPRRPRQQGNDGEGCAELHPPSHIMFDASVAVSGATAGRTGACIVQVRDFIAC